MIGLAFEPRWRRALASIAAMLATLSAGSAQALEAGSLQWHAPRGSAASASVDLRDKGAIDPAALRARIAAREAYAVAGLDYHPAVARVQLSTQPLPGGRAALDLLLSLSHRRSMTAASAPASSTQPAVAAEDPQVLARAALEAWAQAWSRRDVEAYFAAYAPGFDGRKGHASREAWMAERRERILSRRSIGVTVFRDRGPAAGRPDRRAFRAALPQRRPGRPQPQAGKVGARRWALADREGGRPAVTCRAQATLGGSGVA